MPASAPDATTPHRGLAASCNEARMTEVLPDFLYISDMTAALDEELIINQKRITHIVNCSNREAPNKFEKDTKFQVKYLNVDVEDDGSVPVEEMVCHFQRVHAWIVEAALPGIKSQESCIKNARVLVHCLVGKSRSASVVTALLMQFDPVRFAHRPLAALRFLQEKRPVVRPNAHFLRALLQLSEWLVDDSHDVDRSSGAMVGADFLQEDGGARKDEWEQEKQAMRQLIEDTKGREKTARTGQIRSALDGIAGQKRGCLCGTLTACVVL